MATTYSQGYKIKLIGTGLEAGTWGTSTNENWKRLEQVLYGVFDITITAPVAPDTYNNDEYKWTLQDTADAGEASGKQRAAFVTFSGSVSAEQTVVICGATVDEYAQNRVFCVKNNLGNGHKLKISTHASNSNSFTLQNGAAALIYSSDVSSGTVASILDVIQLSGINMEGGAGEVLLKDDTAVALDIKEGTTSYLKFKTTNDNEEVEVVQSLKVSGVLDVDNAEINTETQATTVKIKNNEAASLSIQDTEEATLEFLKFDTTGTEALTVGSGTDKVDTLNIKTSSVSVADQTTSISLKDNEAAALDIKEASNSYLKFDTTNDSESVTIGKTLIPKSGDVSGGFGIKTTADTEWLLSDTADALEFRSWGGGVVADIKTLLSIGGQGSAPAVTVKNPTTGSAPWSGAAMKFTLDTGVELIAKGTTDLQGNVDFGANIDFTAAAPVVKLPADTAASLSIQDTADADTVFLNFDTRSTEILTLGSGAGFVDTLNINTSDVLMRNSPDVFVDDNSVTAFNIISSSDGATVTKIDMPFSVRTDSAGRRVNIGSNATLAGSTNDYDVHLVGPKVVLGSAGSGASIASKIEFSYGADKDLTIGNSAGSDFLRFDTSGVAGGNKIVLGHTDSGGDASEQDVGVLDVTTARHGTGSSQYKGLRIDVPDDSWEALTFYNAGSTELFAIDTRDDGGETVRLGVGVNFLMRNATSQLMQNGAGKHGLQTMRMSSGDDLYLGGSTEPDTGAGSGLGIQSLVLAIPQDGAWVDAGHSDRKNQFRVQYGDGVKNIYHTGNDTNLAKLDAVNTFDTDQTFNGNVTVGSSSASSNAARLKVGNSGFTGGVEGGEIQFFNGYDIPSTTRYDNIFVDVRANTFRIFGLQPADSSGTAGLAGEIHILQDSTSSAANDLRTTIAGGFGQLWGGGATQSGGTVPASNARSPIKNYLKSPHELILESGSVLESATPLVHTVNSSAIIKAKHVSESSPSTIMTVAADDNLRIGTGPDRPDGTHFVTLQHSDGTSVSKQNFRVSYTEDGGSTVLQGNIYHTRYSQLPTDISGTYFEEPDIATTANTSGTYGHGLLAVPRLVYGVIKNTSGSTQHGYVANEEVIVGSEYLSVHASSSDVKYTIVSGGIQILDNSTRSLASITANNWKLFLRCWK